MSSDPHWKLRWLGSRDANGRPEFAAQRTDDGLFVTGGIRSAEAVANLLGMWDNVHAAAVDVVASEAELPIVRIADRWDPTGEAVVQEYVDRVGASWVHDKDFYTRIANRFRTLRVTDPLVTSVKGVYELGQDGVGTASTYGWVDPKLVVATPPTSDWGAFGQHHPVRLGQIITRWMHEEGGIARAFQDDPILLDQIPGPDGPLYINDTNGNHRIHAARAVDLPLVWAEIIQRTYKPGALERIRAADDWQQANARAYGLARTELRSATTGWTDTTKPPGAPDNPFDGGPRRFLR